MKKTYSTLLAATGMAACLTLGLQGTATAAPASPAGHKMASEDVSIMGWPEGCTNGKYGNGWYARCTKPNGGSFKASVTCKPYDGGAPFDRWAGHWETSAGGLSVVNCPPMSNVVTGGFVTRSTR
ncbi:hypothetical protein [Streptomyces sp. NPDC002788]